MTRKRSLLAILITILTLTSAAQTVFGKIGIKTTEKDVVIDIKLGTDFANQSISIEVLEPQKELSDITDNDSDILKSVFSMLFQEKADHNGNLSLTFVPSGGKAGWYKVRAAAKKFPIPLTESFAYAPEESVVELLNLIKGLDPAASSSLDIIEGLFAPVQGDDLEGYLILGLFELNAYKAFDNSSLCSEATKRQIYKTILQNASKIKNKSDVQDIFSRSVSVEILLAMKNSDANAFIADYDFELGISDSPIYRDIYLNPIYRNDGAKRDLISMLKKRNWTADDKNNFKQIFDEYTFLSAVANASGNSIIGNLIEICFAMLEENGANLNDYEAVNTKTQVWRQISGEYQKIEDFISAFNQEIKKQKDSKGGSVKSANVGGSSRIDAKMTVDSAILSAPVIPVINPELEKPPFDDLDGAMWAKEGIEYLVQKGIVNGKEENKFFPNDNMTREEFIKILILAAELYDDNATVDFADVKDGEWHYKYVASAANHNLINGYGEIFGIGDYIKREDVAVIVFRTARLTEMEISSISEEAVYKDWKEISSYAQDAVSSLSKSGIINGTDKGEFLPRRFATRAEAAQIIYLLLKK